MNAPCCDRSFYPGVRRAFLLAVATLSWATGASLSLAQDDRPQAGDEPEQTQSIDAPPISATPLEDASSAESLAAPAGPLLAPPQGDDFTGASLVRYQQQLERRYGGYSQMPLDVKAEYFDWELWRYHITPDEQAYHRVVFPEQPGARPIAFPARDSSTWNGSLLAATCFRYAVTHEAAALDRIARLVRGLHLFFEVTGMPGLPARAVARADGMILDELKGQTYTSPEGVVYHYHGDAAKGGFIQIATGYAALMMLAYKDLPPDVQTMARDDMHAMILHMIDHGWRATNADGSRTTYGDMRPLFGTFGVPFNAQAAYLLTALGYSLPPDDPAKRERIAAEFRRLRGDHHVYYEHPWASPAPPQKVAGSPFVKGMNDRNHAMNAAFFGLLLELDHARRNNEPYNDKFVHRLGLTMVHGMEYLYDQRNSLNAFMWAGLLGDPRLRDVIVTRRRNEVARELDQAVLEGVEQLRRFALDRFEYDGPHIKMDVLQWNDDFQPDDCYWKVSPYLHKPKSGPRRAMAYCAADYLYAYWLLRYFRLEERPPLAGRKVRVLVRTPGLP